MPFAIRMPPPFSVDGLPEPPLPIPTPVNGAGDFVARSFASFGTGTTVPPSTNSAWKTVGPVELMKDSVILRPVLIDVGTSAVESTHRVELWHTFKVPLNIQSLVESGTQGMVLTRLGGGNLDPIPANDRAEYDLLLTLNTESVLDGSYEWFVNGGISRELKIIGLRAVIFPFIPQGTYTKVLEFATSVLRTKTSEERYSTRDYPRMEMEYTFHLDPVDYAEMKTLIQGWNPNPFAVPIWPDAEYKGRVESGTNELTVTDETAIYEVGGMALLWDSNAFSQVVVTLERTETGIIFEPALAETRLNLYLAPVGLADMLEGSSTSRSNVGVNVATINFSFNELDQTWDNPFPLWRGEPVLTWVSLNEGSFTEDLYQEFNVIDFTTGVRDPLREYEYMQFDRNVTLPIDGEAALTTVENFIGWSRGQYNRFWVPSWNDDLKLQSTSASGSDELEVEFIGIASYRKTGDITIVRNSGQVTYHRVINAYQNAAGNDVVVLETPLDFELTVANTRMISELLMCRMGTDRFEFAFTRRDHGRVSFPVKVIPEGDAT